MKYPKLFPNIIDVTKAPYFADNTGKTDCSEAFLPYAHKAQSIAGSADLQHSRAFQTAVSTLCHTCVERKV